jgi:hypothetical protein
VHHNGRSETNKSMHASALYSVCELFEFQRGIWLSGLKFIIDFLSSSSKIVD